MQKFLNFQRDNLFLYAPFLIAFGAGLYFTLSYEPSIPFAGLVAGLILITTFIKRVPVVLRGGLLFLFGFYYACAYTNFINIPQIARTMRDTEITAKISNIDYAADKTRLYMESDYGTIRVSTTNTVVTPNIGDTVRATVTLFRPSPAYAPATFDYARWAYFNGLSATGYVTDIDVIKSGDNHSVNALRNALHIRSQSFLSDSLVLGYKNTIPSTDKEIWMATGIGHVWSISGFHMALVGGWLFAIFYLIFRATPFVTRRTSARIPATICAWVGLVFYLFLSGIDVATLRAFLMTSLMFLAFIFGRNAFSLRNIAIAFCIIFLINPHYVMQAGFQLSFSAVFGLTWFWTVVQPKIPENKITKVVCVAALTSVVATIFTLPFVMAHFGAVPIYGLIGNLILLPIFSFAIMPCVFVGTIIGSGTLVALAHNIYDVIFVVAEFISKLPGAIITVPHVSNTAMMCFICGLMLMIFIKPLRVKENYILGGIMIMCGVCAMYCAPRPAVISTHDNELVTFIYDDKIEFTKSKASNHFFAFDTWKQFAGFETNTPNTRTKPYAGQFRYNSENFNLVYIQKFVPLMHNINKLCRDSNTDFIVSYFDIRAPRCEHKILRGAFIIYDNGRVQKMPINRRWHNPRG